MLTEKDYCDYETCVALIDLGYPEHEILSYDFNLLLYDAQKWLREEKGIMVCLTYDKNTSKWIGSIVNADSLKLFNTMRFDSYEEALLKGIKEAVKILKEK